MNAEPTVPVAVDVSEILDVCSRLDAADINKITDDNTIAHDMNMVWARMHQAGLDISMLKHSAETLFTNADAKGLRNRLDAQLKKSLRCSTDTQTYEQQFCAMCDEHTSDQHESDTSATVA